MAEKKLLSGRNTNGLGFLAIVILLGALLSQLRGIHHELVMANCISLAEHGQACEAAKK